MTATQMIPAVGQTISVNFEPLPPSPGMIYLAVLSDVLAEMRETGEWDDEEEEAELEAAE